MPTSEAIQHINSARQVLVGVVPNPTSQIDQITNALIYKFMDDMDQSAIKAGGKPSFFTGELGPFSWSKMMNARLGNQERMNLYSEALVKFSEAKQLPELFRNIFRSAFLPYRSPETLWLFLKEINYFDYSHPEELGNAYEYLLSIMSSQGDAGQFRTPRHIIDFIVKVVNPTKEDKVLDPACGTGGFLVSSYKHILEQHDGVDEDGKPNNEKPLTPDDKKKIMKNFEGYDIDPGMVRIAQVNMYLHQFKNPKIYQYDSLSSEERWGDKFDVILANPPFMSPRGGIRPHSKFSVQSTRSEVLFVDYIMNHLRPKGRAGIIVPEGVIFQSGTAYKQLRKNLVEDGLYAVVSLPSGVFNPYAGVKTSILLFDNEIAKKTDEILFIKILNDGFDLGAQRRPRPDLPNDLFDKGGAVDVLNAQKVAVLTGNKNTLIPENSTFTWLVKKEKIAENTEYNLSGDLYRLTTDYVNAKWPVVEVGEVCSVSSGNSAPQNKKLFIDGRYPFYRTSDVGDVHLSDNLRKVRDWLNDEGVRGLKLFKKGTILFPKSGASTFLNHRAIMGLDGYVSSHLATIVPKNELINTKYLYHLLTSIDAKKLTADQAYPSLKTSAIARIKLPLPPLEIQRSIVEELDGYQKIIDGAKQIVANWKPKIDIHPSWEKVKIGDIASLEYGIGEAARESGEYRYIRITDIDENGELKDQNKKYIKKTKESKKYLLNKGDVLIARTGATFGKTLYFNEDEESAFAGFLIRINFDPSKIQSKYFWCFAQTDGYWAQAKSLVTGGGQPQFNANSVKKIEIPLPSLAVQKQILNKIEAEYELVESAKKLISIYEEKMKEEIDKVWEG